MFKELIILVLLGVICITCVEGATVIVPSTQIANCYANDGESSNVTLYLDQAKDGLSGYKMTIGFSTSGIAKINSVSFPEWTNTSYNVVGTLPGQTVTLSAADLYEKVQPGSGKVPLCSLDISGITFGTTSLTVGVIEMTNDYGKPIPITPYPYSSIVVYSIPPLQASLNAPRDMNHDGFLDDFNGNRVIDINDIVVFFQSWSFGITNSLPVAPFDYNGNGRIDVNDIVEYFNLIW
jgi:hypothetical protein